MSALETQPTAAELAAKPTNSSLAPSSSDRFRAELDLLGSLPHTIGNGIAQAAESAWQHKGTTAFEIASGLALGAAFTLLTKNPNPAVAKTTLWLGRAFIGVALADLGYRFGAPMANVWSNPNNLKEDEVTLGDNVGGAVVSYGLAMASGGIGAKLGEQFIAPTKIGSWLQGYDQVKVNVPPDGQGVLAATNHDGSLSRFSKAFNANAQISDHFSGENVQGNGITLRTLPDGSQIGSTRAGVLVETEEGTSLWFKSERSLFGLRTKLQLERVLHPDGSFENIGPQGKITLSDSISPTGPYLDPTTKDLGLGQAQTANFSDGTRLVTNPEGAVVEVDTPSSQTTASPGGVWNFKTALQPQSVGYNLDRIADPTDPYKKGFLAGFGEMMLERAGDVGTAIFANKLFQSGDPQGKS